MEEVATDAPTPSGPIAPRKLAYDRLILPVIKLKNSTSSKQLEQRLNYLWSSSHAMLLTNTALAHNMASTIMETARMHRLELPAAVLDYLCPQCGGLTVPSISADIRVVSQHHKSKLNRKIAQLQRKHHSNGNGIVGQGVPRRERLRNALQVQCHRCGFQNLRHGATVVHKPKTKKSTNKRPLGTEIAMAAVAVTDAKRAKKEEVKPAAVDSEMTTTSTTTETEKTPPQPLQKEEEKPRSIFAKPPSSPRRLLDTKKKKKKSAVKDAAASAQVKSSLDSLLSTLKK